MVQSVELLLDEASDALIRAEWGRLLDAGLPSQARHTGRSNRPHITLGVARAVAPQQETDLGELAWPTPLPLVLGSVLMFGRGPFVLARSVVPTVELLTFQTQVVDALGEQAEPFVHQQGTGRWTGHVTLARKLGGSHLDRALDALGPLDPIEATAVAVRRWDGDTKVEWIVHPADRVQARLGN